MISINSALLGIDYGTKRIGIATCPPGSSLAFPHTVIKNDNQAISKIVTLIENFCPQVVVIGKSVNLIGKNNELQKEIMIFLKKLKYELGNTEVKFEFEPEHYTSFQAERYQGKHPAVDASAASIILQAWIDRCEKINNEE